MLLISKYHYPGCSPGSILFCYSYRRESTGFLRAAFQLCRLTVAMAINKAMPPARTNTHQLSVVLYAKFSSHLFMTNQAMGQEIIKAKLIHLTKPWLSRISISETLAPFTLRTPISLMRCSVKRK